MFRLILEFWLGAFFDVFIFVLFYISVLKMFLSLGTSFWCRSISILSFLSYILVFLQQQFTWNFFLVSFFAQMVHWRPLIFRCWCLSFASQMFLVFPLGSASFQLWSFALPCTTNCPNCWYLFSRFRKSNFACVFACAFSPHLCVGFLVFLACASSSSSSSSFSLH